jgi:hypothetical protein
MFLISMFSAYLFKLFYFKLSVFLLSITNIARGFPVIISSMCTVYFEQVPLVYYIAISSFPSCLFKQYWWVSPCCPHMFMSSPLHILSFLSPFHWFLRQFLFIFMSQYYYYYYYWDIIVGLDSTDEQTYVMLSFWAWLISFLDD